LDFATYGTDFVLFLNYPFIKLGCPFWFGFLLYGMIGFLGIVMMIKWVELTIGKKLMLGNVNVLYLFFLMPNFHFWTANIGKESLMFFSIASLFYAMASRKFKSMTFIVATLLLLLIRPHVALMLLLAIVLVIIFDPKFNFKKRITILFTSFAALLLLFYMVLQLTKIKYFDWNRIMYFNDYSIRSFKHSGSYVPMLNHNYFYRIFSFNFRPLFYDVKSFSGSVASIENLLTLIVCLLGLFYIVKLRNKMHYYSWMKIAFWFSLIASLLYIQRYANLGIFMRTKIMFQPFLIIAFLSCIKQGFELSKVKK
jgi:low affinity Fe/Cu permease